MEEAREFKIDLPSKVIDGKFADFASIWHTPNVFVLDFVAVTSPPKVDEDPHTGEESSVIPGRVVSRIKLPPEQVFEVAKALTQQLEAWEQETGRSSS